MTDDDLLDGCDEDFVSDPTADKDIDLTVLFAAGTDADIWKELFGAGPLTGSPAP